MRPRLLLVVFIEQAQMKSVSFSKAYGIFIIVAKLTHFAVSTVRRICIVIKLYGVDISWTIVPRFYPNVIIAPVWLS